MFTKYDKAGAGIIGAAIGAIVGYFLGFDVEATGGLTAAATAFLVWLVPNKPATP